MTDKPTRIQRKRTAGWRMPEGAVYVGRPSIFGNPFKAWEWAGFTPAASVVDYRLWLLRRPTVWGFDKGLPAPPALTTIQRELRGRDLACWCKLGEPCHADVLLELANK